ncbi:MAG: hypothetical protein PVG75_07335, partial [Thioalkalispiraceae bacterium]
AQFKTTGKQESVQELDCVMNSPLLFGLLDNFQEDRYYQVLDIMPASNQLLQYFSAFHSKLYLPACYRLLQSISPELLASEEKLNLAVLKMLDLEDNITGSLDLILLWDLPNYLDKDILQAFIQNLLSYCSRETLLHIYIYTREKMPVNSGLYQFQVDNRILVKHESQQMTRCPMYYQELLQKLLSPFMVERGILLSNGMQEYLLKRP